RQLLQQQPHPFPTRRSSDLPRVVHCFHGGVVLVDTPEVCRDIEWLCDRFPLDMDPTASARLYAQVNAWTAKRQAIDKIHAGQHRSEEHTSELQSQSNIVCRL